MCLLRSFPRAERRHQQSNEHTRQIITSTGHPGQAPWQATGKRRRQGPRHGRGRGPRRAGEQTAYEHWHGMLFARFLAENGLLMHPDDVPLTLDECNELARDEAPRAAGSWLGVPQGG